MDQLIEAIHTTPIIDNHAHPLPIPSAQTKYPLLSITTEAHDDAMSDATSSLSHIRAVKQLSHILECPATWEDVQKAIALEKDKPDDAWARRCMEGIETILVDDGLDGKDEVFNYSWHDRLTRSPCKRIVRIEKVAEEIIDHHLQRSLPPDEIFETVLHEFEKAIKGAALDPEVVGFKSVICYRTGLDISSGPFTPASMEPEFIQVLNQHRKSRRGHFKRLDGLRLNSYLVDKTALIIATSPHKKPLQFHTGLGDNDITLTTSSPSHLQNFIRRHPDVPIVLLHASYPWTKEAGYLASVYKNVYADFGEVFPFLSQDGQETVVREMLEICPTEKILWSTDGHWFPETYLLAVIQVREALEVVLSEYVAKGALSTKQAIRVVEDMFFDTSNKLYGLNLQLNRLEIPRHVNLATKNRADLDILTSFLKKHPETKFLRLQYLDYTATSRLRVVPIKRGLKVLRSQDSLRIGITTASLALLQNDTIIPCSSASGEYLLEAIFSSIRPGPAEQFASVQSEFRLQDGTDLTLCPRSTLRRSIEKAKALDLEFLLGFEIEIVFMSFDSGCDGYELGYKANGYSKGHAWNSSQALQKNSKLLTEIYDTLANAGIELEQWHPESASGQFEFVLPPLPPLAAVDTLLHAREIIQTIVSNHGMRATLHPKPFPMQAGTASHVHISISSPNGEDRAIYESFYAGILAHLPAIVAFTYSNPASYDRVADGCWAGGRWVAWGTQNRETPLRKISGSHWEIKCLDGLANVYLAMAAIITAGIGGVAGREKLIWGDCQADPATLSGEDRDALGITTRLPQTLKESLGCMASDIDFVTSIGVDVVRRYIDVKSAEMALLDGMDAHDRKEWIIDRY